MVDLTEFSGEDALRASLLKKRAKVQEKLTLAVAKAQEKIAPLQLQIEKFDALLEVLTSGVKNINVSGKIKEDFSADLVVSEIKKLEDSALDTGDR